ncbi:protein kinase [Lentisphaera profundi]|uniref:Protein kinase n=1 Tax=Lentisphaera profundi TaxID=1658616 RepID=A0ABY7VP00_9BACT|nr:protein kinase [Lentisphaera profundi]WDE95419.1 protein kinase [Lentisphaera profundi]
MSTENNTSTINDDSELSLWKKNNLNSTKDDSRYSDISLISSRKNKNIYSAHDKKFNRTITLVEPNDDNEDQLDFINEILITSSFEHPNIIQILDFGVWKEDIPYYTMQETDSLAFKDYISNENSSESQNLTIFLKTCEALSYAHSKHITHNTLDTTNIHISPSGEVTISGWKQINKVEVQTQSTPPENQDKTKGTASEENEEADQEKASEENEEADQENKDTEVPLNINADISSLGSILKILYSQDPEKNPPEAISVAITKTLTSALTNNPEQSYQNVNELKGEIEDFLKSQTSNTQEAGFFKSINLLFQENQSICSVLLLTLGLLIAFSVYSLMEIYDKNIVLKKSVEQVKKDNRKLKKSLKVEATINAKFLKSELQKTEKLMSYPLYFQSPNSSSKQALDIYFSQRDQKKHHKEKFMILMIRQDFESIVKRKIKAPQALIRIARNFAKKPKAENGLLKEEKDFNLLLILVNKLPFAMQEFKEQFIERAICYRNEIEQKTTVSPNIVRQLIKVWNPDWSTKNFSYNPDKMNSRLKGSEVKILLDDTPYSSGKSFLRFLKINNLDLRQSGIESLDQINGLKLQNLDIRATNIQNFPTHETALKIDTLLLNPDQFDDEALKNVPATVNIIKRK